MIKNTVYTLCLLVASVDLFYFGYNGFFKTQDFFSKYERFLNASPKIYRKQVNSISNKIAAFAYMIGSALVFIIFIIQLLFLMRGSTLFYVK